VPEERSEVVSQIDVLPTIAGLIHQPYLNTTLGRDVLSRRKKGNGAFVIHHDEGKIGLVTDSYYFIKNIRFEQELLYPVNGNSAWWNKQQEDSIRKVASPLTTSMYETAKWMLINNKKP
jgi:L-ascorbate metabolism protein UlaG (beta-lactamase superfamily)